jgi:hemolysin III
MFANMREPVNVLTHFFAALAAAVGVIFLLILGHGDFVKQVTFIIYGACLVLLFSASAAYHMYSGTAERLLVLRKLDHSAIYTLIAGTYTPICFNLFSGFWRWGMLAIIWSLALVGIGVKVFVINSPRWLTAGIYLVMGWLSLLALGEMLTALPRGALVWLLLGGLFFTVGAVIYITKWMDFVPHVFGFHEVWHIFVILGCLCHYVVIAAYVARLPRVI